MLDEVRAIFRYQIWHLCAAIILVGLMWWYGRFDPELYSGDRILGMDATGWFWVSISVPILHQFYVWLVWRLELHLRLFSRRLGVERAFLLYAVGFSILFVGRLFVLVPLAMSNAGTLHVPRLASYGLAALLAPVVFYLFYSVKRYFTLRRAYGIDHFIEGYSEPYVTGGIFRYTKNGMYIFGLMILYFPGLLLQSKAALVAALFNHVFIWAHYFFTERPDMEYIYGRSGG